MTRAGLWFVVWVLAITLAVVFVGASKAENYGGVSNLYAAKMRRMIHAWFDKHGVGYTMVCIATRESGLNSKAFNNDDAPYASVAGLFQIKWPLHARRGESWSDFYVRMTDPVQNIRLAYRLYRRSGLQPWGGGC